MTVTGTLHIEAALGTVRDAAVRGLFLAGEHVLTTSNVHVPHEYGDLQGSGAVSEDAGSLTVAVSYNTPYALKQHEDLTARHDAGRTAKYLENAVNSEADKVAQIVASTIHASLGD